VSESPAKRLLVVGAGVEAVPGIRALRAAGLEVVATDRDPAAPGLAVADEARIASTYDAAATIDAARAAHAERPLAGVMCIATDVPLTVALVAEALGLPGLAPASARLSQDKLAQAAALERADVPVPWTRAVASASDLEDARRERGGTLVVKPADGRGARGVLRLLPDGLPSSEAFAASRASSPTDRVLAQEWILGPQLSTESLIVDGRVHTVGVSDRNYARLDELAPHVIEDGGDFPSEYRAEHGAAIDRVLAATARALGVTRGTLKGDLVLDPERGPVVIEAALRLSGGTLSTVQIPFSTGVPLVHLAARLAMGETPEPRELEPRHWKPLAIRYLFPPEGTLVSTRGLEEVRARPGCLGADLHAHPGDTVGRVADHTARAGWVMFTGADRAEARERALVALDTIELELSPA
jgi:biotin carboxylase